MRSAATLLLLAALAGAGELEWKRAAQDWYGSRELALAPDPPAGVAAAGEGLLYFAGPCGERRLLLALAPTENLLRVDRDFDGDLRDETPLPMLEEGSWRKRVVEMEVPEPVAFFFFRRESEAGLTLKILAHREGTVVVEGRARRVLLLDHDQDLRFDGPEDRILVDLDGDGLVDRRSEAERVTPGQPFLLRGRSYVVTLVGAGGRELLVGPSATEAPRRPAPWRPDRPPRPRTAPGGREPLEELARQYEGDRGGKKGERGIFGGYLRRNILRDIGRLGTPDAFAFLYRVYRRERDEGLLVTAVESMGYESYADRAKEVAAIARGAKSAAVQRAAIDALHFMDAPDRAETYARLLSGQQEEAVFAAAARNLGYLGTPEALKQLDEAATHASPVSLRVHAYEAATRWRPGPPPAELVVAAARQADPSLRALALKDAVRLDLAETRSLALDAAKGGNLTPELMLAVAEILGTSGDAEAVRALLPFADGATPALEGRLVDLLRAVRDEEGIDAIVLGLDSGSPPVRALAANVLREIPGDRAAAAIVARLRRERQEPALTALIRAAGRRGLEDAAAPIVDALRRKAGDEALTQTGLQALARIGFANPAVSRFVADRLASSDWLDRLAAIDCAVASGDPAAAPLLAGRLDDRVWQVRFAAAQALGVCRARESVPLLIAALGREERLRIRRAIGESLFRLTGEDYGDLADIWARWWHGREGSFELPSKVPQRKEAPKGERRTVAAFYGVPIDSDRVAFVLDISSSMGGAAFGRGGTELEQAVQETLKVVKALPDTARVNVIVFESEIRSWKRSLTTLGPSARRALAAFLAEQRPTGSTNLFDALEAALQLRGVETVYLLSDGDPTTGRLTDDDAILEAVRQLNHETRAAVHCIALGGSSRLLRRIAEATMGTYVER